MDPDIPSQTEEKAKPQLLAGKYKSLEDFEKGYEETRREGLRQRDRAERLEKELAGIQSELGALKKPDALETKWDEHFEDIPLETLDARVESKALKAVEAALKPLFEVQQAEASVRRESPDFPGIQAIAQALAPETAEAFQKLLAKEPEAAMKLGLQAWKQQQKPDSGEVRARAREVAEGPRRKAGGEEPKEDPEAYRRLLMQGVTQGDWTPFLRYRFGERPWYKKIAEGSDDE